MCLFHLLPSRSAWFVALILSLLICPQSSPAGPQSARPARFQDAVTYAAGGIDAVSVAVADLNGDGTPDLVVLNSESQSTSVGVLLGKGDGTFQPVVTYDAGGSFGSSVVVADVNGDGKADLIVASECPIGSCGLPYPGTIGVLLGNGDGTFQGPVIYAAGVYSRGNALPKVAVADVNGDGKLDIVVSNECASDSNCNYPTGPGGVSVLLGNGDGNFQSPIVYSSGGYEGTGVVIADVNGDGKPDLLVSNDCFSWSECVDVQYYPGGLGVLLGNGDGTFQPPVSYESGGYLADSLAVADLNHDGKLDVAVVNKCQSAIGCDAGNVSVLLGNGDGSFQAPNNYSAGFGSWALTVAIGDVNGDGNLDLVTTSTCFNCRTRVSVLPGNGDGTFQPFITFLSGGYLYSDSIAIADLNHDGRPDIVVADSCSQSSGNSCSKGAGAVGVLLNNFNTNTTTTVTSSSNPSQVNQTVVFTATVTSVVSTPPNGSTVTFFNHQTELGTGTTTNGVATFAVSFSSPKTYTIRAVYAGDGFHKASSGSVRQVVK
jgi:hypothetical protein